MDGFKSVLFQVVTIDVADDDIHVDRLREIPTPGHIFPVSHNVRCKTRLNEYVSFLNLAANLVRRVFSADEIKASNVRGVGKTAARHQENG